MAVSSLRKNTVKTLQEPAATSVASEAGNLVCPGEDPSVELTKALTRIFCDYHNKLSQLREMGLYDHTPDPEKQMKKVAGQFIPYKMEGLVKVFGREKVESTLNEFKMSGTDLTNRGPLNCDEQ